MYPKNKMIKKNKKKNCHLLTHSARVKPDILADSLGGEL